jgi:hypothetical protein
MPGKRPSSSTLPASRAVRQPRSHRAARWEGSLQHRPPTDAEAALHAERQQRIARAIGVVIGLPALVTYVYLPNRAIHTVLEAPPPLRRFGVLAASALTRFYPWCQFLATLVLALLLLHLCLATVLLIVQRRQRARATFHTLALDIAPAQLLSPLHGVDLFVGWQRRNVPYGRGRGSEENLVFALISGDDGRMQLRVRGPVAGRDWTTFLRQQIEGRCPGTTTRLVDDDLVVALMEAARTGAHDTGSQPVLAWSDLVLRRDAAYPLNDLSQFDADPIGPLALALRGGPNIRYAAYEIIVRAVEDRWRQPIRTQLAHIQARLTPDDLPGHDALLRTAEQAAYDVVVRCIVVANNARVARAHLRDMREALGQFDRTTRGALQRLQAPSVDRLGGGAAGHVVRIPSPNAVRWRLGITDLPRIAGLTMLGTALGVLIGSGVLIERVPALAGLLNQLPQLPIIPTDLPRPPFLEPGPRVLLLAVAPVARLVGGGIVGGLTGLLAALATLPSRRAWRAWQQLLAVGTHAHRFAWPGPRWPLPLPGMRRSVMGAFDLAALWHVPDVSLAPLVATRSVRALPTPAWAFLDAAPAAEAERRVVLPPPRDVRELAQRRLGLAIADRPDGTTGLIGPTIRDLRKGMEVLGPMGSGKSCFVETLAVEIARNGGGFGLIDAKGDLADRLLAALPHEVHDRVVVIDTSSPIVPCLNPMDARLLRDGVTVERLVGQVGQLFARIDPETWPTSLGMQQFANFGLYALAEGEASPTLLHLDHYYTSRPYQAAVLQGVRHPGVARFWRAEYPRMDLSLQRSVDSFRRRLQQFVTAPLVQYLFCQPQSTIYLPDLMDQRGILIVKLVPEVLGESLARIVATALLATLAAATFTRQQRQPDPEQRWDWPLIIDEVQKFIDVEHVGDAETFLTQTRSLGVGLIGAHQGLWQLGEAVQSAVVQSLGGLCVLGPVKQDARVLVEAYAETGITEADLAALRAQHELLIRFPVRDRDSGLLNGVPRQRPPVAVRVAAPSAPHTTLPAAYHHWRAPAPDAQAAADDAILERLWYVAQQYGPLGAAEQMFTALEGLHTPDIFTATIERLRARSAVHRRAQAEALEHDPSQAPDSVSYLRERSALRYGVDPVVAACYARALTLRYPDDPPAPPRRARTTAPVEATTKVSAPTAMPDSSPVRPERDWHERVQRFQPRPDA